MSDDDASDANRELTRGLPIAPGYGQDGPDWKTRSSTVTKKPKGAPMQSNAINEVAGLAREIGRQHADQESAWDKATRAKEELLTTVIESVLPALRAISSRVAIRGTKSAAGETTDPAPFRGLIISSRGTPVPQRLAMKSLDTRGTYGGRALVLTDLGVLMELTYEGRWSDVPGEASKWEARYATLTARHVAGEYAIEPIIERLAAVLAEHAKGTAVERTVMLEERARQLQAVTTMLKGMRY